MEYQLFIYLVSFITVVLTAAHISDMIELREFRSILTKGMRVRIKVDDEWYIATIIGVDFKESFSESTCDVELLMDESPCIIRGFEVNKVFKPNNYRI